MTSTAFDSGLQSPVITARRDLVGGFLNWDLWGRLGWLEVKRRYRRTVIGPFWSAISLAVFVIALGSVGLGLFARGIGEYLPFLAAGMVVWVLISSIITEGCSVFIGRDGLFCGIRFYYSILAYALVWRHFLVLLHNALVYAVFIVAFAPQMLSPVVLLAVPGLVLVLVNGVWITLLLGTLCLRYRDVQQFVQTLVQISMFVTPIFWPPEALAPGLRGVFVTFNPLHNLIEIVRGPLLGRAPSLGNYAFAIVLAAAGWAAAYAAFRLSRRRAPYWC